MVVPFQASEATRSVVSKLTRGALSVWQSLRSLFASPFARSALVSSRKSSIGLNVMAGTNSFENALTASCFIFSIALPSPSIFDFIFCWPGLRPFIRPPAFAEVPRMSAYITGLILYDLLVGGPHKNTTADCRSKVQRAITRKTVSAQRNGRRRKLLLDHLIERAIGRPVSDDELEKMKAQIVQILRSALTR